MKDTSMLTGRWRLTKDELPPPCVPLIIAWKKGKRMMIDHDAAYDPKGKLKRENWSRPGDVDFFRGCMFTAKQNTPQKDGPLNLDTKNQRWTWTSTSRP